ncbi:NYN domain-containing protein [Microaerobacter geothermalis]|uniref:NYN domain-containing protein n=1 Tax=Microaerobacter geothermalis TaxID=674972 RepID=UPI001F39DD30|nr:NYN domain-containing protein [Microaerobacter geothermalis]MCF6095177.1 NYN domain-containing protein [Microaerobacter geothermalis]
MEQILIVDGYNIIGDWPHLRDIKQESLEDARDMLLKQMAEYQAFSGIKVYVVFDAHKVPGAGKSLKEFKVTIYYTKKDETADELIEKLVKKFSHRKREIYVATSDYLEQRIIFGSGALRKSARELLNEVEHTEREIHKKIQEINKEKRGWKRDFGEEIEKIFEKWRRGL